MFQKFQTVLIIFIFLFINYNNNNWPKSYNPCLENPNNPIISAPGRIDTVHKYWDQKVIRYNTTLTTLVILTATY